ncbi:Uncharacterized protein Rs2_25895 [Raphanus sativus]|nr:Uncharacterized protein Rs2_25895 [Raphanus sativus]
MSDSSSPTAGVRTDKFLVVPQIVWGLNNQKIAFDKFLVLVFGISLEAKVDECRNHRKRNHRIRILNKVEFEIEKSKEMRQQEEADVSLWKCGDDKYKRKFLKKKPERL